MSELAYNGVDDRCACSLVLLADYYILGFAFSMARRGVGPTANQVQLLGLLNAAIYQLVAKLNWLRSKINAGSRLGGIKNIVLFCVKIQSQVMQTGASGRVIVSWDVTIYGGYSRSEVDSKSSGNRRTNKR